MQVKTMLITPASQTVNVKAQGRGIYLINDEKLFISGYIQKS